jgi:hypothetical protein
MLGGRGLAQTPAVAADVGERLARLEEGQRSLEKRLEDFRADVNRRFDELQTGVNHRFEGIDRRFDELRDFIIWGFGVTFAGMFTLIGFVLWDRRTALAPAVRRADELHDREQRLEAALRDYAARTPDLAESLRKAGLL